MKLQSSNSRISGASYVPIRETKEARQDTSTTFLIGLKMAEHLGEKRNPLCIPQGTDPLPPFSKLVTTVRNHLNK